jgi:hypothetical protein
VNPAYASHDDARGRIHLALSILQAGRPMTDHTARLAAAALLGTSLRDLVMLDAVGFPTREAA